MARININDLEPVPVEPITVFEKRVFINAQQAARSLGAGLGAYIAFRNQAIGIPNGFVPNERLGALLDTVKVLVEQEEVRLLELSVIPVGMKREKCPKCNTNGTYVTLPDYNTADGSEYTFCVSCGQVDPEQDRGGE